MNDKDQMVYGLGTGLILGSLLFAYYDTIINSLIVGTSGCIVIIINHIHNWYSWNKEWWE